jgi:hypothetical protein
MRSPSSSVPRLLRAACVATALDALALAGCIGVAGNPAPVDRAVFPTGLALDPAGDRLVVVSSNFDLAYDDGAVLLVDLAKVRAAASATPAPNVTAPVVVTDAVVDAVALPSFGDAPVIDRTGRHVLLTTRGGNLLHELVLGTDGLSCDAAGDGGEDVQDGDGPPCASPPHALQLASNDPFDVVLLEQTVSADGALTGARALVTHLSSATAELVRLDPGRVDEARLRVERAPVVFGDDVFGVRSAVFVPAVSGHPDRVVALLERRLERTIVGCDLAVFAVPAADRGDAVVISRTDVTALTGALTGRDLVVVGDGAAGGSLAAIVALRSPDAVARFALDDVVGSFTLTHIDGTCRKPTGLATAVVDVDGDPATAGTPRVLLTCQDGQVVESLDPLDLSVTDAVRFLGRSPYDVVVDEVHQQAFVSFFLDGSVGVLSLVSGGRAQLTPVARIGSALPRPEDGRE